LRFTLAIGALLAFASDASAWRSRLYPTDWSPGFADGDRRLGDFSYAGYHAGEDPLPASVPGPVVDVTAAPYGADPTGAADSTAAIQAALEDVGSGGGGTVHLPAGTYRVRPPAGQAHALLMRHDGVVLRGDGPDATFLFNDETDMRDRRILLVAPRAEYFSWWWGARDVRMLAADAPRGATRVTVGDAAGLEAGDLVLIGADATEAFIAERGMTGTWSPADTTGPIFYRRVMRVDGDAVQLDAPLRFALRTRDAARLFRPALDPVEEVGVEGLSIGNRQNTTPGTDTDDHARPGTGGYQMHASFAIYLDHVVDGWIRDVHTYRPATNGRDVHVLSNTIRVDFSRHVTLTGLDLANAQYQGAGGNGYHVALTANDTLVTDSVARGGRHNYSLSFMHSSGNVLHEVVAIGGRLPVDFHQRLAFENLLDRVTVDDDSVELVFRDCCGHGHSTTESVVWNLDGRRYPSDQLFERFVVDTQQLGHGYVVGTRGAATNVRSTTGDGTAPRDHVEGVGDGATLEPASLYLDQRARRLGLTPPAVPDAGPPSLDAGRPPARDAGGAAIDAGGAAPPALDGGVSTPTRDGGVAAAPDSGGCSVGAGGGSRSVWAPIWLLLALFLRRRRRSAPPRWRSSNDLTATVGEPRGGPICTTTPWMSQEHPAGRTPSTRSPRSTRRKSDASCAARRTATRARAPASSSRSFPRSCTTR